MKNITSPFRLIKKAFEIFGKKKNFVFLIQIYIPIGLLSLFFLLFVYIPFLSDFFTTSLGGLIMTILNFLFVFIMVFVNLAGIVAINKILDGESLQIEKTFTEAWHKYFKFLFLSIILYLVYALGIILLVIPFIFVATWFVFSKFIVAESGMGIWISLAKSRKLVKGIFWKIFIRIFVFALFTFSVQTILMFLPFGIGTIVFSLCGALFVLPTLLLYKEIKVNRTEFASDEILNG